MQNTHTIRCRPHSAAPLSSGLQRRASESLMMKNTSGPEFFKNTRVSTCREIKLENGKPVAVPFRSSRNCLSLKKNMSVKQIDIGNNSIYQVDFRPQKSRPQTAWSGMTESSSAKLKPLVAYHPDHSRNRLMQTEYPSMSALSNNVQIGNFRKWNERKWGTEYSTKIGNFMNIQGYTNPGIIKRMHLWHNSRITQHY